MSGRSIKTVPVLSWVYWNGSDQGGGGFAWFPQGTSCETLLAAFDAERRAWAGSTARVRLVMVPGVPAHLDGQELTDYLDGERLDDIEAVLTSERVALVR